VRYLVRKFPAGVEIIDRCGAAHGCRSTRLIGHSHVSGGRTVLDLRHTAIDADFASVHEGGVVGGEKCSRSRNLFGSPQFLAWNC
jgi:hypothetical protein